VYEAKEIRGANQGTGKTAGRRDTPTHDERPDDGDRLHLLCAGLGWSYIRATKSPGDASETPGLGIKERFNVRIVPSAFIGTRFALEVGAPGAYDTVLRCSG